jgi:hypothetical protein
MWKPLYDLARILFGLAEHVQEDRDEIKEIRRDLRDLTVVVQRLRAQLAQGEQREREMLKLRLENSILRRHRGLPAAEADNAG